jgi:hypothetical protein
MDKNTSLLGRISLFDLSKYGETGVDLLLDRKHTIITTSLRVYVNEIHGKKTRN